MMKYPKIKQLGDKENEDIFLYADDYIVIQEKIDGANFRFMLVDGEIMFGSRTRELGGGLEDSKQWKRCIDYINEQVDIEILKKYDNCIFFGESCTRHSTPYDFTDMPPFLGFDVYNTEFHRFASLDDVRIIFKFLRLPIVPCIRICKACEMTQPTDDSVPKSLYYDGQAEGIVFKNYKQQIFAKFVTKKHKESATKVFGGSRKWATDDVGRIVATYCTNPRIEKMIYKLMDDGEILDMKLMSKLPNGVFFDIRDEHYKDILSKNLLVDVGLLRKQIAKRCLSVLKQFLTNQAFEHKTENI